MKNYIYLLCLILSVQSSIYAQESIDVTFGKYDKVTSNGYGVTKLIKPTHDSIYFSGKPYKITYPNSFDVVDTAFTTIYFTGIENGMLDRSIGVLVTDYTSKKPTFYIDGNGNMDFSDDGVPLDFQQDTFVDLYFNNSEFRDGRFGVRLFYASLKKENENFLSQMGPLARNNEFVAIDYWFGEYRLNNRFAEVTHEGTTYTIALHDYNCNGTFDDKGKDKILLANPYDQTVSTQRQHGAEIYSDSAIITLGGRHFQVKNIDKTGKSMQLLPCNDGCEIANRIRVGDTLSHSMFTALDSTERYLNEVQEEGKYLLLDVWGLWCKGCLMQQPHLEKIYTDNSDRLQILSLNWGDLPASVYTHYKTHKPLWNDNGFATKEILEQYMVESYPNFILVDPSGKIIKLGTRLNEVEAIIGD